MPLIIMKTSEQITNQLRIQGLMKPLKIPVSTLSKWRDEFAKLEAENNALRDGIADAIGKINNENDPDAPVPWLIVNVRRGLYDALLRKETPCP